MTRPNRHGPWLPDEDEILLELVCSQGPNNWVRISQSMQQRSPKQCRERYHQNLKPSLNHEPISSQEGELIEQMVNEIGKRWAEIARRLRNRSDNAVKNWWNGSQNRRKRNVIQHSHGMKGSGTRLQPIPSVKPLKTTVDRADRRRHHSGPHHQYQHDSFSDSQRSRHSLLPSFPHSILIGGTTQAMGRQSSPRDTFQHLSAPSRYPSYDLNPGHSQYLPSLNQFRQSGLMSSQRHAQTSQQGMEHAPKSEQRPPDDQFRPASLMLQPQHSHEPTLISPIPTEASHAPSLDPAPSLVSDNQSNCSISPRTIPSPRSDMPRPIDTDILAWARQLSNRRDSAPNILAHPKSPSKVHLDEGYVSVLLPQSAVSDTKPFLPLPGQCGHRNESVDLFRASQHAPSYAASAPLPAPADSPTSPGAGQSSKDARMRLSNLLG